jgi:ketosteroid isomerase-like protein
MTLHAEQRDAIERECTRLIYQYAYWNDERNFEALAGMFTEDAVLYRPSSPEVATVGRSAILEAFRKRPAEVMTFHVCSDVLIDVEGPGTAVGRSRILLLSGARPADGDAAPAEARPALPGTFRDRFRLTETGWKFAERRGSFWVRT